MSISTQRILQKSGEFGISIWYMGCRIRLRTRGVAKSRDDISKGKKAAVDRNTLFDTFPCSRSALELFEAQSVKNTVSNSE
jgi:hypothetical protein